MELTSHHKKLILITSLVVIVLSLIMMLIRIYNSFLGADISSSEQENVQTLSGVLNTENLELGENWLSFTATDIDGHMITAFTNFTVVDPSDDDDEDPYGGGDDEDPDPYGGAPASNTVIEPSPNTTIQP